VRKLLFATKKRKGEKRCCGYAIFPPAMPVARLSMPKNRNPSETNMAKVTIPIAEKYN
jgi:hypothetical protein